MEKAVHCNKRGSPIAMLPRMLSRMLQVIRQCQVFARYMAGRVVNVLVHRVSPPCSNTLQCIRGHFDWNIIFLISGT